MLHLNKKELKKYINENGFFWKAEVKTETNAPKKYEDQIPEGAIYFTGLASNGELNRNGYIIREKAINGYMDNPLILLQHDSDQPIGKVLSAKVKEEGLVIEGYVFDDLTGNRFSRGLFPAISTGHITNAVEFENAKTGEILDSEAFSALNWNEQMGGDWIMAVTELEYIENSVVTIGSNRKALIKNTDIIRNYLNISNPDTMTDKNTEEVLETTPEVETPEVETTSTPEEAPSENAEATEETVTLPKEEVEEVKNAISTMANMLKDQSEEIARLKNAMANTPVSQGIVVPQKVEEKKQEGYLANMLRNYI